MCYKGPSPLGQPITAKIEDFILSQPWTFENHFSQKVVEISFAEGSRLHTPDELRALKQAWTQNLKSWHSPYTAVLDFRHLTLETALVGDLKKLIEFFKKFFMRKALGIVASEEQKQLLEGLEIDLYLSAEEAYSHTGLSRVKAESTATDLRSQIRFENDFKAHVIEVSFLDDVYFGTTADVAILKSKLLNNLKLWHTPFSLMIDCTHCTFSKEGREAFGGVERFLKGVFCKAIIGYARKLDEDQYPFLTFRSRHKAAAQLEHSGLIGGDTASCGSNRAKSGA